MSLPENSTSLPVVTPVSTAPASARPTTTPPARPDDDLPSVISVMCPSGFTAHSTEGVDLNTPLFARVTYRRTT